MPGSDPHCTLTCDDRLIILYFVQCLKGVMPMVPHLTPDLHCRLHNPKLRYPRLAHYRKPLLSLSNKNPKITVNGPSQPHNAKLRYPKAPALS